MSMQDFLDNCENRIDIHSQIGISFSTTGFGFGQIYFTQNEDGTIRCDNECMTKEQIKKILSQMVDQCILNQEPLRMREIDE